MWPAKTRGRPFSRPRNIPAAFAPCCYASLRMRHACAPNIYAGEQEQPYDVDEVPVPGGKFEAEMMGRAEMALERPHQADDQENRTDDDVCAMEASRHEKRRAVD